MDARGGGIGAGWLLDLKEVSPVDGSVGIVFGLDLSNSNAGTVYDDVTLQEDLTIGEGESLDIPSGASLTIGNDATLTNEGTVTTDDGTLTNNGTINNSGTLPDNIGGNGAVNHAPTITTESLPGGPVGTSYSQTLTATGTTPITWSVTSGSLPAGLTLNGSTGEIAGTPTTAETSTFTVKAENDYGNDSTQFTLTIETAAYVPVNSVSLSPSTLNLVENETGTLTATVEPSNATNKDVTWESSNTSVATVDASGLVTAVSAGITNITATADGNKTATCTVTVVAKTYGISASPASLDFGGVYTGYAQPTAQTVTVTNTGNQSVKLAQPASTSFLVGALSATELAPGKSVTFSVQPKPGLAAGTHSEQLTIAGAAAEGESATCAVALSFSVRTPYVPPRPTGPDWGDVANDIAGARPGSTVKVDMDGKTVLPGEVLDELAGRDVTLALDMGDGLFWEIYGGDVPADAEHGDVDLGVALGGDSIPADVVNLVTGESGSVQVSLEHDGSFGFELTLVAPLGEDAAGLVANLYRYNDETGSLGYEATAQVDGEGVARLPFDHASSWLVALDSRGHALPFSDANDGEWYSEAVRWAWLGGVMTGYGDGSGLFGTSSALTRAEAAVALWRLAGEPEGASGLPADCDPSGFYAEAASWALGAGVFSGYSGDAFGPADPITREQLATVLWRAAGSPEAGGDLSSFSDAADVSGFADVAMRWAVSAGVLRGQGDGDALDPQGACTRAQLATMLHRLAAAE
ncbi:S-layer homology domain-containing protein [Thermophilibacter mediterraneus]|uniref:S-layer homology domain-containing protein n=1 Tax=Thermophilibacter mediterraneus TaxID=1871031 RepID=UPI0013563D33|nr:S-layer homology domain-containing protein [Thermophilibacter mediterraneus]